MIYLFFFLSLLSESIQDSFDDLPPQTVPQNIFQRLFRNTKIKKFLLRYQIFPFKQTTKILTYSSKKNA